MPETIRIGALLSDFEIRRIVWRSRGRLARGKITVLDGDGGLGKSTMLMDWVAKVTCGQPLPDEPYGVTHRERGVILLSAEDDPNDTMLPRLIAAGGDPTQVMLLNEIGVTGDEGQVVLDDFGDPEMRWFGLPGDIKYLEAAVKHMDAGLVIIDPLFGFLSKDIKSNSDEDMRRSLSPLAKMAQRTGVSVVLVRHLNKGGGTKALYRGSGSVAISSLARIGLLLGRPKDQPDIRVLASVKNNISPLAPSLGFKLTSVEGTDVAAAQYIGEVAYTAEDLLQGEVTSDQERDERDEAMVWLEGFLEGGARNSKDVFAEARKVSISSNAIRIAKDKLGVTSNKSGFSGGTWMWELPKPAPGLEQAGFDEEEF